MPGPCQSGQWWRGPDLRLAHTSCEDQSNPAGGEPKCRPSRSQGWSNAGTGPRPCRTKQADRGRQATPSSGIGRWES
eukprot:5172323-Amphidinium_carterae.2